MAMDERAPWHFVTRLLTPPQPTRSSPRRPRGLEIVAEIVEDDMDEVFGPLRRHE